MAKVHEKSRGIGGAYQDIRPDPLAEIAIEIERLFGTPSNQAQVSRAVRRADDGLQAIKANLPVSHTQRTIAADPSQNEPKPKLSCGGQRVVRKVVVDRDDRPREPA